MSYKADWYKGWSYIITDDNGYKIEIPHSATEKVIVGNKNNELLMLVLCLFDLVDILEKGGKKHEQS